MIYISPVEISEYLPDLPEKLYCLLQNIGVVLIELIRINHDTEVNNLATIFFLQKL